MAESRWKLIVGKKISEPAYISPESLREDYARAMAETTFSKNFGDLEKRIKEIEDLKQTLGPDVVKRLSDLGIQLRESSSKKKKPEPCKNGKCQHVIAENQLEEFLANGYYVVAVLQSGKVVVSNEA